MKLCVIGLGQMGLTLIEGLLEQEIFTAREIIGCDPRLEELKPRLNKLEIISLTDNRQGVKQADIVLLAVKPQVIPQVMAEIKEMAAAKLIISIAAGITIDYLQKELPASARIVRVMPNTPALVKTGISAISPGPELTAADEKLVKDIFQAVGKIIMVKEELMDAVTGLSGSGPAYGYLVIEALADGGVQAGLSHKQALQLAAGTMLGAAQMILATGKHPGELKKHGNFSGGHHDYRIGPSGKKRFTWYFTGGCN